MRARGVQAKRTVIVVGARARIVIARRIATRMGNRGIEVLRRFCKHPARNARLVRSANDVGAEVVGVALDALTRANNGLGKLRNVQMAGERRSGMLSRMIVAQLRRRATLGVVEAGKALDRLDGVPIAMGRIEIAAHLRGERQIGRLAVLKGALGSSVLHGVGELVSDNERQGIVEPAVALHRKRPHGNGMGLEVVVGAERLVIGRAKRHRADEIGRRAKGAVLAEDVALVPIHHGRLEALGDRAKLGFALLLARGNVLRAVLTENIVPVPVHDRRTETLCDGARRRRRSSGLAHGESPSCWGRATIAEGRCGRSPGDAALSAPSREKNVEANR